MKALAAGLAAALVAVGIFAASVRGDLADTSQDLTAARGKVSALSGQLTASEREADDLSNEVSAAQDQAERAEASFEEAQSAGDDCYKVIAYVGGSIGRAGVFAAAGRCDAYYGARLGSYA